MYAQAESIGGYHQNSDGRLFRVRALGLAQIETSTYFSVYDASHTSRDGNLGWSHVPLMLADGICSSKFRICDAHAGNARNSKVSRLRKGCIPYPQPGL